MVRAAYPRHDCLAFDRLATFEAGVGLDEGNELGRVDSSPTGLCGLGELEHIAIAAVRLPAPRVTLVRSFTVGKG
jgi:hypothetical protein